MVPTGRRRSLPQINNHRDRAKQAEAERHSVNTVFQGGAADLMKEAMILWTDRIPADLAAECALVGQIHDECLVEVTPARLHEAAALLRACMEEAGQLMVPLRVALKAGPSWGHLSPYPPANLNSTPS
eukprot:CAMPEP_0170159300 /NCGR_PEP_ID=MMETSP0033_2-20121228/70436_1 /TAXON_ID=195969 /ORGANISM="Dolichomastix tenuilepis, Strain CCMP3274" /LENGTH=127 /DNA_ID=CAMNT_0010396775 /DNA_START=82 /DNA_END=465 /DNA_ORIENTATION=+